MRSDYDARKIRQEIHFLKELPPLPTMAGRILALSNDNTDIAEFADTIEKDPCLSARLLGLANAAYFGWPGGVHTMYDAIYRVLGLRMVKSLAVGLILGGVFTAERCRGFSPERYWFTAVATAIMAQRLFLHMSPTLKNDIDNVYLAGLLHNLGLPTLVYLFPREMERVFSGKSAPAGDSLDCIYREIFGMGSCEAGGCLARKWHLPAEIVHTIERHGDPGYRGDCWPVAQLVGYCARHAESLFSGIRPGHGREIMTALGITEEDEETERRATVENIEGISEMARLLSGNGSYNG